MIFDAIVGTLFAILTGVLGFLPQWGADLGAGIASGAERLGDALGMANAWFPVSTLGVCLGIVLAAKLALMGWSAVKFIYDKIPFKAS